MLCLTLVATPYAVAAAPSTPSPPRAAARPEDNSPIHTGIDEGTIHSIRCSPVDDGAGEQVGQRIYAVDASRRQQSLHVRERGRNVSPCFWATVPSGCSGGI